MNMMKVKLIRQYKNHPPGTELDLSKRIHADLLKRGFISKPVPIIFAPDVLKAAKDLEPKRKSRKEPENKKEE